MFKHIFTVFLLASLLACTSSEQVKDINTDLEKGQVGRSKLGVNDDNEAILQTETDADKELQAQIWANDSLESKLQHYTLEFEDCRLYLADPRLGGTGEIKDLPEVGDFKVDTNTKEEIGVDKDGNYKVVRKKVFCKG